MVLLFIFIVGVGCASAVNLDNGANAHLDKVVKDSEAIPISSDDFLGSSASTKTDPGSGMGSARPDYTDVFNSDIKNATLHPIHHPVVNSDIPLKGDVLSSSASTKTDPGSGMGSARPDYTDVFNSDIKNATLHPIHPPILNSTLKCGPHGPIGPQYLPVLISVDHTIIS